MSRANYDSQARHDIVITLYKRGKSIEYCAKICGYSRDYIRQLLTKEGLWETLPQIVERKERKVIEMIRDGYNDIEIAEAVGYKGTSRIFHIAKENGLKVITSKAQEKESLREAMRTYKAEGHSHSEVAEKFGVNMSLTLVYCKGIAKQRLSPEEQSKRSKEQQQKTLAQREEKACQQISQKGYEYVGGYVDTDSFVTIRCPKCGTVFERSMVSIRHNQSIVCPGCAEKAKEEKKRQKAEAKERERQARKEERQERKRAEEERKKAEKLHPCPVCGTPTTRGKYCSQRCANRVVNAKKEAKRRAKIERVLVDKDISLYKLYKRDHGICYLCGGRCDWNDKEVREDGTTVVGYNYPSIDHVIPLAKGGEHSWANVKLAHVICNIHKRDN